ncbi:UNVERIFIED_CONTAM: hypothetical protein HDU68_000375, partial [Siphonaria sp. JEL0065]
TSPLQAYNWEQHLLDNFDMSLNILRYCTQLRALMLLDNPEDYVSPNATLCYVFDLLNPTLSPTKYNSIELAAEAMGVGSTTAYAFKANPTTKGLNRGRFYLSLDGVLPEHISYVVPKMGCTSTYVYKDNIEVAGSPFTSIKETADKLNFTEGTLGLYMDADKPYKGFYFFSRPVSLEELLAISLKFNDSLGSNDPNLVYAYDHGELLKGSPFKVSD